MQIIRIRLEMIRKNPPKRIIRRKSSSWSLISVSDRLSSINSSRGPDFAILLYLQVEKLYPLTISSRCNHELIRVTTVRYWAGLWPGLTPGSRLVTFHIRDIEPELATSHQRWAPSWPRAGALHRPEPEPEWKCTGLYSLGYLATKVRTLHGPLASPPSALYHRHRAMAIQSWDAWPCSSMPHLEKWQTKNASRHDITF